MESVRKAFKEAIEKYGCVDILVNNAGISENTSFMDYTEETFDKVMDLNVQLNQYCKGSVTRLDTAVLARLCCALDCKIEDLLEYIRRKINNCEHLLLPMQKNKGLQFL